MMWSFGGIQDAMDSPGPRPRPEHAQTTVLWGCCRIITKRTASPKPAGEPGAPRLRGPQTPSAGKREDAFQSGQGPPPRTGSGLRSSCGPQPCQCIPTQASCQTAVPASAGCWTPQWPRTASGGGIGFTWPLASLQMPLPLPVLTPPGLCTAWQRVFHNGRAQTPRGGRSGGPPRGCRALLCAARERAMLPPRP